jgi:competence protein ComEA
MEIAGAVESPGVYCGTGEWIVDRLIEEAGGLSSDVCGEWVERDLNKAALLVANSKVFIPSVDDAECGGGSSEEPVSATTGSISQCAGDAVNINTASSSELESLSGVGPSTAEKIISGRPYSSADDLLNISGIGDATLEKIRDDICW